MFPITSCKHHHHHIIEIISAYVDENKCEGEINATKFSKREDFLLLNASFCSTKRRALTLFINMMIIWMHSFIMSSNFVLLIFKSLLQAVCLVCSVHADASPECNSVSLLITRRTKKKKKQ